MKEEIFETFNDVLFVPRYSEVRSRRHVITKSDMGKGLFLELPVISANMSDITGYKMAAAMAYDGGLGIIHRFNNIVDSVGDYLNALKEIRYSGNTIGRKESYLVGVSVGVKEYERKRFEVLYKEGAKIFTVDVAHGHHILVKEMIEYMRGVAKDNIYIIAGNVATVDAAYDLKCWGADCVKVGIGPGSRCITRKNTGVGVPQLRIIKEIREDILTKDIPIISDGGIKNLGDIPKALKYSNAIMSGSLFAGTTESSAKTYQKSNGALYKFYGGSSSGENKVKNGNEHAFVEGFVGKVPLKGEVKYILKKIRESLQSSISYSGCKNLDEFRCKSILIKIGSGARVESKL